MPTLKLVLDTNVYIQSLMRPGSFLDTLIRDIAAGRLAELYTSPEILVELRRKAEDRFQLNPGQSRDLLLTCRSICQVVEPAERVNAVPNDPDDNKILECALEAAADIIITADKDLLKLKEFKDIKIIHPSMLKYLFPGPQV